MWHFLWFRAKFWSFYIQSRFLKRGPSKAFQNCLYFPNCCLSFWSRKPPPKKLLFKFKLKLFECCGALMSLNESSECCDQRTLSPCNVNCGSVQWSTCRGLLGNLPFSVSWFNVGKTGRSRLGLIRISSLLNQSNPDKLSSKDCAIHYGLLFLVCLGSRFCPVHLKYVQTRQSKVLLWLDSDFLTLMFS